MPQPSSTNTSREHRSTLSESARAACSVTSRAALLANFLEDAPATYRHVYDGGSGTPLRSLFPMDPVGIMYTCAGGFIDFGHLRDIADLTFYYLQQLKRGLWRKGAKIPASVPLPGQRHHGR